MRAHTHRNIHTCSQSTTDVNIFKVEWHWTAFLIYLVIAICVAIYRKDNKFTIF